MPFNPVYAIQRIIKCVEQVALREPRNSQLVQRSVSFLLVLREVSQDIGLHVVRNYRQPIALFQSTHERVGRVQDIAHEEIIAGGEFNQQDSGNRRFRDGEVADLLRRAIFGNAEIFLLQAGDELPIFGRDHDRHFHQRHVDVNGIVRHALDLFGPLRRRGGWGLVFLLGNRRTDQRRFAGRRPLEAVPGPWKARTTPDPAPTLNPIKLAKARINNEIRKNCRSEIQPKPRLKRTDTCPDRSEII